MGKIFSTNVFVRGYMAFYDVSASKPDIFHLNLKLCRIHKNPPPKFLRIQQVEGKWLSLDAIPEEYLFIVREIGQRIQGAILKTA